MSRWTLGDQYAEQGVQLGGGGWRREGSGGGGSAGWNFSPKNEGFATFPVQREKFLKTAAFSDANFLQQSKFIDLDELGMTK